MAATNYDVFLISVQQVSQKYKIVNKISTTGLLLGLYCTARFGDICQKIEWS